jgi:hypothetical protein
MGRFFYICERMGKGKARFVTVLCGKKIAMERLKEYAAMTTNEVYLLDILSQQIVATRNE